MTGYPYISISESHLGLWFAIKVWWNEDIDGPEPYETGNGRYHRRDDAVEEGRAWASREGLPFHG